MLRRHARLLVLALAPIAALVACDQAAKVAEEAAQQAAGPAALESVSRDARAISGMVRPQAEVAALIAPEPVLIAPGEIVVGAVVAEAQMEQAAQEEGVERSMSAQFRRQGREALEELAAPLRRRVQMRAEAAAGDRARVRARDVLGRLGVVGEVDVRPGGVVRINLNRAQRRGRPTSLQTRTPGVAAQPGANETEAAAESAPPESVRWTGSSCPRVVDAAALEQDVELATRCAVQRLRDSEQFEYVDPNFIATIDYIDRLPWAQPKQQPQPSQPSQPSQPTPTTPSPTPSQPTVLLPNDPLEALQWHYRARGAAPGQSPGGAGFETFWVQARQIGSRNVRIAIVDTGLDTTHPEISGNPNVALGVDLIASTERAGDGDGVDRDAFDAGDRCGTQQTENSYHGTHVAGTAGAVRTNDRVGVAGGVWNVTIVPVRVLGRCGGELADIASGIRWAAGVAPAVLSDGVQLMNGNPADIINLSLSVGVPCPASMQAAINAAVEHGAVVVVAAGNKANNTRNYAPANCANVIVVGANDERGNLTFYSNFGDEVDVLAPGGDVFADADGDGRPDGILSSRTSGSGCYDPAAANASSNGTCYYTFLQGTSMAAPHVSAALALLASQTGLRGRDLEAALLTRATGPIDAQQCRIECSRNANASPISGSPNMCMRACGRGMLDMARAANNLPASPAAPAGGAPRRRR